MMQFLCFSALMVKWSETKKSCKAWYCFHFTSMVLTAEAWFKGNFFIWSTTLMLLYTSWKGAGHSDTSWEKWTFFPPDSHGTLVLLFFLFPRDEPKTWKLPWVMRYSAAAAGHKTYSQWGKICMANVFSNWDRLSVSDKYRDCWGCLKARITICK